MGVHAGIVCRLGVLDKGIGGERDDGNVGCIDLLAQTNRAGCLVASMSGIIMSIRIASKLPAG